MRLAARAHQCKPIAWAALCLVAGCGTAPTPQPSPPTEPDINNTYASVAGVRYQIDPGSAWVTVKVFRDGPLKALGHNHVITTQALHGMILIADDLTQSRAEVWTAIESLIVDDAAARQRAGAAFESTPTAEDISGTRRNMLGAQTLNVLAHPFARVSVAFAGLDADVVHLTATFALAGGSASLPIDARFSRGDDALTIDTEFVLDQRDLGITPFSVMAGALRVAPTVEIEVRARARRVASTTVAAPTRARRHNS